MQIPRVLPHVIAAALFATTASAHLNEHCTVSVLNRIAQVKPDRSRVLGNVPSSMGLVRAHATCIESGVTRVGQSDYVSVPPSGVVAVAHEAQDSSAANRAFQRGRQLMERHCGDCRRRTTEGVLEAVRQIQRAITLGRNDADVHRLLRDAYRGLAFIDYGDIGFEEHSRHYMSLMNEEIRIIATLDPTDLENRMDYVEMLGSNSEKMGELNRIVAHFPKHAPAHHRLTRLLIEQGDVEGAVRHARRWLDLANPWELYTYSDNLFGSADEHRLRQALHADAKMHPAAYALAYLVLGREQNDLAEGMALARVALDEAPPLVANSYLSNLTIQLTGLGRRSEAATLRSEYSAKAKLGEAQRPEHH